MVQDPNSLCSTTKLLRYLYVKSGRLGDTLRDATKLA